MVPQTELLDREQTVRNASEIRPKRKKQPPARAGSHLAKGTMGRSHGAAVESGSHEEAQKAAAASLRSYREEHPELTQEQAHYEQSAPEPVPEQHEPEPRREVASQPTPQSQPAVVSPSPIGLARKPSVVREEEEPDSDVEEHGAGTADQSTVSAALDAVPIRQAVYPNESMPQPPREIVTPQPGATTLSATPVDPVAQIAPTPKSPPPESQTASIEGRSFPLETRDTQALRRVSRNHSNSPVRNARFGPVQEGLVVKHSPPPRSISPRKSAMKQRSPSRGASPADDVSETSGFSVQEPIMPRKKSVRVSFDDENTVVVGEAAGTDELEEDDVQASTQTQNTRKVPWYSSLTRSKRKEAVSLDDDEVMKPRPALPSFGSVREKKPSPPKALEERPLVRPHEAAYSPPSTAQSVTSTSGTENVGQSSDFAIGGLLQEQAARNEANISKFREPLPPVVTSREGGGYSSDDSSDAGYESATLAAPPKLFPEDSQVSQASTLVSPIESPPKPLNGSAINQPAGEQNTPVAKDFAATPPPSNIVPSISLTLPSPDAGERPRSGFPGLPGGFPETESEWEEPSHTPITSTPVRQVTFEPVTQTRDTEVTSQTPATVAATHLAAQENADASDESSVYSDAYEDFSDMEGDGFQSLDAVVESPVATPSPKSALARAREAQAQRAEMETPTPGPSQVQSIAGPPATTLANSGQSVDGWETAKAYWRSLTSDKRAQLEKEAEVEAGEEGDLEEVNQDVKKPRRKKSVDKRNAEKRAIEQQRAIEEQKAIDLERTYMIKPGTKAEEYTPGMKNTTRNRKEPASVNGAAAPRLRKSMRSPEAQPQKGPLPITEGGTGMRKSMRSNGPEQSQPQQRAASSTKARPMSYSSPSAAPPVSMGHNRAMSETPSSIPKTPRASSGLSNNIVQPSLRRHGSDSSASSFKRARAPSEGFGLRKTMRASSQSSQARRPEIEQSSRFSVRSMSPARSTGMRTTLRGSQQQEAEKGYLRFSGSFGMGKGKGKGKAKKTTSRFGDDSSDDDEGGVARPFRSRFDDNSSDDEMTVQPLQPLPIPKTMTSKALASPPLPEEEEMSQEEHGDDEKRQAAMITSSTAPGLGQSAVNGRPTTGSGSRRGSFMSSLWRKKRDSGGKISRSELSESAARRDTDLERSTSELNALRTNSLSGQHPKGVKLKKRVASMPSAGGGLARTESWPLPDEQDEDKEDEDERHEATHDVWEKAVSPDGPPIAGFSMIPKPPVSAATRPGLMQRRSTAGTIGTDGVGAGSIAGRKKKKFSGLRKMFKLDN